MELIKKTLPLAEANGWYLTQNENRYWDEDLLDEDTGNVTTIERSEVLCGKGTCINPIIQSLLEQNGIKQVNVSNIQILGFQEKHLNLWEVLVKLRDNRGEKKNVYIVTANCPSDAEKFTSEYIEVNIDTTFEITKTNGNLKYDRVIKMYDSEREQYEESGRYPIKWYKCQVFAMIEDDDDGKNSGSRNILVQSTRIEKAIEAVKIVLNANEYEAIYNTIEVVQKLNIVDVFIPDEEVSYYSDNDIRL